MGWHNLVNTRYFSEAAIDFRKNGGRYTLAPRGSREYFEYWTEQDRRCRDGYSVGDTWIPGRYYFYLNFSPMWKVDDKIALKAFQEAKDKNGKVSQKTADKILDFGRVTEMQYEYQRLKHIAWNGGEFMGIKSPGGKHWCCGKTRGAGVSYMEASDGVYNFNFIPGSKTYYMASLEEYLTKDGILNKVEDGLNFINSQVPWWKQNRQKKYSTMHQRASFVDAQSQERGSMAEIIGTVVNNPNKTRGKRGKAAKLEEFGSFPNGEQALEILLGSMRDGDFYVGQVSLFGTGGHEGVAIEALERVFYNPTAWDMLEIPNIFENGTEDKCGYFIPSYRANFLYHDADGNCDWERALASDLLEREKKKADPNPKVLDRRIAEYPHKPGEAFQRLSRNGFNIAEINAQILYIESSNYVKNEILRNGYMIRDNGEGTLKGVRFVPDPKAKPVPFPHNADGDDKDNDLTGCVTICERPQMDQTGKVVPGKYKVTFDAYYKDEAQDVTSLFSMQVWNMDTGLPVAWAAMRPKSLNTCYEYLFMLCDYYNCTAQGEISGGGQGVVDYARINDLLDRVDYEPEMLHNKELATNQRNRSYLMNMTTDRKRMGIAYAEDWHVAIRGVNAEGKLVLNVHKIYDVNFLKELKKAGSVNTDRLSSAIIAMYCLKEYTQKVIQSAKVSKKEFYSRAKFTSDTQSSGGMTSSY